MQSTRSTSVSQQRSSGRSGTRPAGASLPLLQGAAGTHQLLYRACADVLATAAQLPGATQLPSPAELRQQLSAALDKMVGRGRRADLPDADLAEARYALVALLDEQVLRATWFGRSEWMSRPLQLELYRDNNAGEDFFVRLSALLRSGNRPLAVQVYYLCLVLGFRGMYEQTGDRKSLAKFTRAARQQLLGVLPPSDSLSPHGAPQRRANTSRARSNALLWLFGGGLSLVLLSVTLSGWFVERALRAAVSEISEPPTLARIIRQ